MNLQHDPSTCTEWKVEGTPCTVGKHSYQVFGVAAELSLGWVVEPFEDGSRNLAGIFYTTLNKIQTIQHTTKEWSQGCVNLRPPARGSQEAGFTEPRDHSFTQPCNIKRIPIQAKSILSHFRKIGHKYLRPPWGSLLTIGGGPKNFCIADQSLSDIPDGNLGDPAGPKEGRRQPGGG